MAEAIAWLMKIPDERIQMACQAAQTKKKLHNTQNLSKLGNNSKSIGQN